MQLDLSDAERGLEGEWRAFTADLTPATRAAWTRQGWIPRSVVDAAPHARPRHPSPGHPRPGHPAGPPATPGWAPDPADAISIMESARLHEGAPELLAGAMLRRFLDATLGSATPRNGSHEADPPGCLILPSWSSDSAQPLSLTCRRAADGLRLDGVGTALAADCSASRAWVVAAFPGAEPTEGCVAETALARHAAPPGRGGPDGYQVWRDHAPHRFDGVSADLGADRGAGALLTAGQLTALRDLTRIGAACVLVGLIDTVFDAIVAQAQRQAAASADRWAAQADKHRGVGIAMHRDIAWLHLFRALDAFGDPGARAMFSALALTEAAAGLGHAIDDRRRAARLAGHDDVLLAASLAAAQRGFWLELAGGSGALTQAVSAAQLGNVTGPR